MANQEEIRNLLKEGVEAAREGDIARARQNFLKVTELDINNERGWLWLATVTDDEDEKRVYLENVLHINPENEKARQMIDRLEGKAQKASRQEQEIITGVSRRQAILYGSVALGVFLLLEIILIAIGSNRRTARDTEQRNLEVALAQTQQAADLLQTEIALNATTLAITEQAILALTVTPTPTDIPLGIATLPPTWTPTAPPELSSIAGGPTVTPLAPPPAEQFAGSVLVGLSGIDRLNVGGYPVVGFQLDRNSRISVGDFLAQSVDIDPSNGQFLSYVRYYPLTFDFGPERSNLVGANPQRISEAWEAIDGFLLDIKDISYSPDGTRLVFTAPAPDNGTEEIWLLDFTQQPAPNTSPLRRITNDNANYQHPDVSPDNGRIIAVKRDPTSINPDPDIISIDISNGSQTALTTDGAQNVESYPRWHPNGNEFVYVASRPVTIPNQRNELLYGDIVRQSISTGAPARFIAREPLIDETRPVFSPDGLFIAYASNVTGQYNIFIKDLQTEQVYQVSNESDVPTLPLGWYQPNVVPPRQPQVPIPTPILAQPSGN